MSMATTPKHKPKLSYKAQSFPSSDKPFECTACQLYFRRLHDLKRHERLHTGERPYCCNNCGRTFARLDALKRHLSAESNVHCSEWTYQPGLAMGLSRGSGKSHQRSLSLPHVHGSTSRVDLGDLEDASVEQRTPTTPSPQDHLLLPFRHFHHNHPQPQQQQQHQHQQYQQYQHQHSSLSPASSAAAAGFGSSSSNAAGGPFTPQTSTTERPDMDGDTYMARRASPVLSSSDHHRWRKDHLPWVGVHKRSLTQPSVGKLLPSDMIMDDSPVFDRSSTHPLSSPMAHTHPHAQQQHPHSSRPHSSNNIHNTVHNEPHPQYSLAAFKRVQQPRPRRDSHPSLSSRSTLSPSLSPALSPSPSSISPSSMSSPTNVWSYSKGFEYYDNTTASTPTNNNGTTPDRRTPQQQEPRAAHARSESSTFPSFRSSSSSSSSSYRHDRPAIHNEDDHRHNQQNHSHHQQPYQQQQPQHRETERHPATSLATILNNQPGQSPTIDRHSPPPSAASSSHSQQPRPAYFSHRPHSQSLSHIHSYSSSHHQSHHQQQQHHQNHHQQYQHLQHLQQLHQQQHHHHNHHHLNQPPPLPPQHPLSSSSSFPHDHRHPPHIHDHDGTGHCCDAMAEIQQLRQELDWYRSLAEKNDGTGSSGSSENNSSQFNGRMITSP